MSAVVVVIGDVLTQAMTEQDVRQLTSMDVRAISAFKVIGGDRFWYHSKAHIRLPI